MKKALEDSPWIKYAVVIIFSGLAFFLIYRQLFAGRGGPSAVYYYNLDSQELQPVDAETLPPVELKGGGIGVEAYVVTCSVDGQKILYLKKMSDAARDVRSRYPGQVPMEEVGPILAPDAYLVSTVELVADGTWYPVDSSQGQVVIGKALDECPSGGTHTFLLP